MYTGAKASRARLHEDWVVEVGSVSHKVSLRELRRGGHPKLCEGLENTACYTPIQNLNTWLGPCH